jgi:hypothetical protein
MKKFSLIAAVMAVAVMAYAGFDMYSSKNYTTLLAPVNIGSSMQGATNVAVITTTASVANSAVTGVDCVGLPGRGALVMSLNPGNGGAGGIVSISFSTCATTNGTYITVTNAAGVSSWSVTTTPATVVAPVTPGSFSRYWRATATATTVTNGSVSATLVTE